jgi:hypothetical protein
VIHYKEIFSVHCDHDAPQRSPQGPRPAIRKCDFCGQEPPLVTYKKIAHIIPEGFGNKDFTSWYECDTCNAKYADFENHLARIYQPERSIARIKGKNGGIAIKLDAEKFRMESHPIDNLIKIWAVEGAEHLHIDEDGNLSIHIPLTKLRYDIAIKSFLKMAYSVLGRIRDDVKYFMDIIDDNIDLYPLILDEIFFPGPGLAETSLLVYEIIENEITNFQILFIFGNHILLLQVPDSNNRYTTKIFRMTGLESPYPPHDVQITRLTIIRNFECSLVKKSGCGYNIKKELPPQQVSEAMEYFKKKGIIK